MNREIRVLVEPVDPRRGKPGGVDTCIRGLIKFHGPGVDLRVVGVDAIGDSVIGEWTTVEIDGRDVPFLPVYRADNTVIRPRVPHVAQLVFGAWRFRRRLRELGPLVIQTHRVTTGFVLRRLLRATYHVQFIHNDGTDSIDLGNESYFKHAKGLFRILERSAVKHCADVVVFNRGAAERLGQWGGNVRFSPTWFDDEYFGPTSTEPATRRSLLWVGRFEATKDPLLAVEAMQQLSDDYELTMVGGGSLMQAAQARAAEISSGGRIRFTGPVPKRAVADLLRSSDLLLMTSLHEGFPRAVVEALASGLPVVTSDGGEPNGLVVDGTNGTRFTQRDPQSVARAVRRADSLSGHDARLSVAGLKASRLVPYVLNPTAEEIEW